MLNRLKSLYKFFSSRYQTAHLEYKTDLRPRSGYSKPLDPMMTDIIRKNSGIYTSLLTSFLSYKEKLQAIKKAGEESDPKQPTWNNGFLPGLDIVALYGIIALYKPKQYIEVGSGNSTRVAKRATRENGLTTKITSIDPYPRADVKEMADTIIAQPVENIDHRFIAEELGEGDILFIDNSHRSFSNSDVTVCFLEILPYLKRGVIVHVHDIYLPYDYPQFMCDRFYNEQYLLAAFILANPDKYKVILPNYFISEDKELSSVIAPIWDHPNLQGVERHGGSLWLQVS